MDFLSRFRQKQQTAAEDGKTRCRALLEKLIRTGDLNDKDGNEILSLASQLGRDVSADVSLYREAQQLKADAEQVEKLRKDFITARTAAQDFERETESIIGKRKAEQRALHMTAGALQSQLDNASEATQKLERFRMAHPNVVGFEWKLQEAYLLDGDAKSSAVDLFENRKRTLLHDRVRATSVREEPWTVTGKRTYVGGGVARNELPLDVREELESIERSHMQAMQRITAVESAMQATGLPIIRISRDTIASKAADLLNRFEFIRHEAQDAAEFDRQLLRVRQAATPMGGTALASHGAARLVEASRS